MEIDTRPKWNRAKADTRIISSPLSWHSNSPPLPSPTKKLTLSADRLIDGIERKNITDQEDTSTKHCQNDGAAQRQRGG